MSQPRLSIKKISNNYIFLEDEDKNEKRVYHGGLSKSRISNLIGRPPKVIVEFGSFDGGDGLKYKLDFPEATVVSIEACPDLFSKIKYLESFGVVPLNYVVSDHDGEADFYQSYKAGENNKGVRAPVGSELRAKEQLKKRNKHLIYEETPIKVPSIRLETLARDILQIPAIDYLHIDTQGTFLYIMRGLGELRPSLVFAEVAMFRKYYGADTRSESNNFMKQLGYKKINQTSEHDTIYILKKEV